ncbi:MAG TPA: hypothetical protein VFE44_04665 [Thermoanaerobaculia bacterium]|nr:hypothetical protein [Thermoanaerobaculia bacterium]
MNERRRPRSRTLAIAAALALAAAQAGAQAERWLHVKVEEHSGSRARVSVNIPCSLAEAAVGLIPDHVGSHGRVRIDHAEIKGEELRAFLTALRDARDAPYVTVESDDGNARIWKAGETLHIHATKRGRHETVEVKLPMAVVDALVSGPADELNVAAAMRALAETGAGEVVAVDSDDATVRIWVDDRPETK